MVVDNVKQATTTTAYANAVKDLSLEQAKLALSTKQLSALEKEQILIKAGLLNATGKLTTGQLTEILTTKERNAEDAKALLLSTGLISAETAEATAVNVVETAKLEELVATKQLTVAEAELIAMKAKVTAANIKEASTTTAVSGKMAGSISILGSSVGSALTKIGSGLLSFASAHPVIAALTAIVGLVGITNSQLKKYEQEQKELIENAKTLQDEYRSFVQSSSDNINSLKAQADEFEELSKGVTKYGENISLSADEYDRYKSIVAEVLGYTPELKEAYDKEGTAIANKNSLIERSIELMKEEQRQKLKEMTTDEKTGVAYEGAKAEWDDANAGYEGAHTRNEIARWFENNSTSNGWNYEVDIAKILGIKDEWSDEGNNLQNAIINNIDTVAENIKNKKAELLALEDEKGVALFTEAEIDNMIEKANDWEKAYVEWQQGIEDSKHGMDDQFALYAQRADGYDDLTDAQRAFVDEYIKATGDIVDADGHILSEDEMIEKAESYEKFVDKLATSPEFADARKKINELFALDSSTIPAGEYEKKVNDILEELQTKFDLTDDEVKDFKIALGFDFIEDGSSTRVSELVEKVQGKLKDDFDDKALDLSLDDLIVASNLEVPEDVELSWEEFIKLLNEAKDIPDEITVLSTEELEEKFKSLNSVIDEIQSNYNTLASAVEEYNSQGYLSLDTLQSLLDMDSAYLACLVDENGQLSINTETINALMEAKLNEAEATAVAQAMTELNAIANGEAASSTVDYVSGNDILINSLALLAGQYDNVANAAMTAAQAEELAAQISSANSVDSSATRNVMNGLEAKLSLIRSTRNNISTRGIGSVSGSKSSGSGSSSSKETKETFDWIETAIKRVQRVITNLGKTVSATYKNWSKRNNAISSEMSAITQEMSLQQSAYEAYMQKAESIGLSDNYKVLVQNGALSIEDITDDTLKEQIKSYQEFYEKALECADAVEDLRDELAELAKTKFDNVVKKFDNELSLIEHRVSMLDKYIDQTETKGELVSKEFYTALIYSERNNIEKLQNEYDALFAQLQDSIATGGIEVYSDDWYDMVADINDVEEALVEANTALIEYEKSMSQLEWDNFDYLRECINDIVSETEFLADLLDNHKLFNESGELNKYGESLAAIYGINYNTYMNQADEYAKEIRELDEAISLDPYDTDLLDRRKELYEAQRDAILNAESEKDAIRSLIDEAYDAQLDALQKLIDKKKELLNATSDLYEYENEISDKTSEIASYEKQLMAYQGDDSEEGKANAQKISVQLEKARKDLKQTEYEKWKSDQEAMLDNLYDEYEQLFNTRLDDMDAIVQDVIDQVNANSVDIQDTVTSVANQVGYSITSDLQTILDTNNGTHDMIAMYGENFTGILTTTNTSINNVSDRINAMISASDANALSIIQKIDSAANAIVTASLQAAAAYSSSIASMSAAFASAQASYSGGSSSGGSGGASYGGGSTTTTASKATSKYTVKLSNGSTIYTSTSEDAVLKYISANGYAITSVTSTSNGATYYVTKKITGSYITAYSKGGNITTASNGTKITRKSSSLLDAIARSVGEDVMIAAKDGERVLTPAQNSMWETWTNELPNLVELSNNLSTKQFFTPSIPTLNVPSVSNRQSGGVEVKIDNIEMHEVNDPVKFTEQLVSDIQSNKKVQNILLDLNSNAMLGKNSLGIKKY